MEHSTSLVNLSIPKDVTAPIVAAKIQEAVMAAMGGADKIVTGVVHQICNTKVSPKDGKVSTYSSENTMAWIDFHVTELLQNSIKEELRKQIHEVASPINAELIRQINTKKGASMVASALLGGLEGSFKDNWASKIEIKFETKQNRSW